MALAFQQAAGRLSADEAFVIGAEIAQLYGQVETETSALAGDIAIAQDVGLGAPNLDGTDRAAENQALQQRHAALSLGAGGLVKLQLASLIPAIMFRGQQVPGAQLSPPPQRDFAAFLHREIGRTTMLISTVEELRARMATLEPSVAAAPGEDVNLVQQPPRDLVDLVQQWQRDHNGYLFLVHVLGVLGLSSLLATDARDGRSLAHHAKQIARNVPQTPEEIVDTLSSAARAASDGQPDDASQLVDLALERMAELGNQIAVQQAMQDGGGEGATVMPSTEIVSIAETRVRAIGRLLVRANRNLMTGAVDLGGLWDEAITAVRVATPVYLMVSGEMSLGASPFANADAWQSEGLKQIVLVAGAVATGGALAEAGVAGVMTGALRVAAAGKEAFAAAAIWAASNPQAAAEVIQMAAAMGLQIGENGVGAFLEQLTTPEGIISLLTDFLAIKQAGGGSHADGPQTAASSNKAPSGRGDLRARALDFLDTVEAKKDAFVAWSTGKLQAEDAVAVGPGGQLGRADEPEAFKAYYEARLNEKRVDRAKGGFRSSEPTPAQRLAAYHPPDSTRSTPDVRRQLAVEARAHAPTSGSMSAAERAAAYKKQVAYFDHVEQQARQEKSRIEERRKGAKTDDENAQLDAEYQAAEVMEQAAKVKLVGGALPRNHEWAGKTYPASKLPEEIRGKYPDGVKFRSDGFPDFEPYARVTVPDDGLIGDTYHDFSAANRAAKFPDKPKGRSPDKEWTWHHHQDGKRMQWVPTDLHDAVKHTGGGAIVRARAGDEDAAEADGSAVESALGEP